VALAWRAVAVAALFVALAGCGGGKSTAHTVKLGDGTRETLDLPQEMQPDKDDIRGVVSGIAVDDGIYPLPNATVKVTSGLPREVTTNARGLFVLQNMTPGLHALEVAKDGYAVGRSTVNVKSGEVAKAVVMAARIPYVPPYHFTQRFESHVNVADFAIDPLEYHEHAAPFDFHPETTVIESTWKGMVPLPVGNDLSYKVWPASDEREARSGMADSPLRLELNSTFLPPEEFAVRFRVVPSGWAPFVDATGETFVTYFYVTPAPEGWSFLEGDP
jgi:hypothetical protein